MQRMTPSPSELTRCHVLYIGTPAAAAAERLLASVERAPVLTVGETPAFAMLGGAISFVVVNDRVRFDINLGAAERGGLTISSKLLRVARHIDTRGRS